MKIQSFQVMVRIARKQSCYCYFCFNISFGFLQFNYSLQCLRDNTLVKFELESVAIGSLHSKKLSIKCFGLILSAYVKVNVNLIYFFFRERQF